MQYMILLVDDETAGSAPGTPEWEAEMAGYERFDKVAGDAIVAGEALLPAATATTVRSAEAGPRVTAGPFAETNEVVGGLYVMEAADLDAVTELVRHIPAAATGAVEIRPLVQWFDKGAGAAGTDERPRHVAFIWSEETAAEQPGTPEWESGAAAHGQFTAQAGSALRAGAAMHPAATATTLRVRGGEVQVTDGPYSETREVIGGLYLFDPTTPQEAVALAGLIPCNPGGAVELRPIMEVG